MSKDFRIEEIWKDIENDLLVTVVYYKESREIVTFSCDTSPDSYEFPRVNTIDELINWEKVLDVSCSEIILVPFHSIHTIYDDMVKISPELANNKLKVQALLKRLVHSEKLSTYQGMAIYFKEDLSEYWRKWLDEKIETHTEFLQKSDNEIITW